MLLTIFPFTCHAVFNVALAIALTAVISTFALNVPPHTVSLLLTAVLSTAKSDKLTVYSEPVVVDFAASSENASAAGASVATAASDPSLNSAAHTGTLEVASIATTSDILNVFFAMPFFVFLIFVMIIVPLWVVDRLIFEKISYGELISDLRNVRIL